jgi:hypothetical protein
VGVRTAVRHGAGDHLRAYRKGEGRTLNQQAALWGIGNHVALSRYERGHSIPDRIVVLMVRDTGLALCFLRPELKDPAGGGFAYVRAVELERISGG